MADKNLVLRLIARTSAFERGVRKSRDEVRGLNASVTSIKRNMRSLAATAGAALGVGGLAYGIRSAVREYASFDQQMARVSTMLDDQSMRLMPAYRQRIRQFAVDFGASTEELSGGLYNILSASVPAEDALKSLAESVVAAKAGITDTSTAAYAGAGILNAYKADVEDLERIYDILFSTVKRGQTTFAELSPVIGRATAIAAQAGVPLEEVAAAISTITRAGISTEEAITGLRQAMIALQGRSPGSIALAKKHGVELSVQALASQRLAGMIRQISALSPGVRKDIFSEVRARTALGALLQDQNGFLEDYELALDRVNTAQEAYTKQTENMQHSLDKVAASWNEVKLSFAESMEIGDWLDDTAEDIRGIGEAVEAVRNIINDSKAQRQTELDILERYKQITGDTDVGKMGRWIPGSWVKTRKEPQYPAVLDVLRDQEYSQGRANAVIDRLGALPRVNSTEEVLGLPGGAATPAIPAPPKEPLLPKSDAKKITEDLADANNDLTNSTEKAVAAIRRQIEVLHLLNSKDAESAEMASFMIQAREAYGKDTAAATDAIHEYRVALEELTAAEHRQQTAEQAAADRQAAIADVDRILTGMRMELDMVGQVGDTWHRSREHAELHAAAVEAAAGNAMLYAAYMAQGAELFERYRIAERWAEISQSMEHSFSNAIDRMIFEGEKFGDSIVNVLREIAVEMVRVMTIRPAAQALAGGLSGMLGGLFGQTTAAATTISPTLAAGPADAWLDTLPHYGDGGFVSQPHVAVVGEVPEVITPISKLSGAAGPAPQIIVYEAPGAHVDRKRTETFHDGEKWVVKAWLNDWYSGGDTRKAVRNPL